MVATTSARCHHGVFFSRECHQCSHEDAISRLTTELAEAKKAFRCQEHLDLKFPTDFCFCCRVEELLQQGTQLKRELAEAKGENERTEMELECCNSDLEWTTELYTQGATKRTLRFVDAMKRITKLEAQFNLYIKDTSKGLECPAACNSHHHDDLCPVINPVEAWRQVRAENERLTGNYMALLQESEAEVAPLRAYAIELKAKVERLRGALGKYGQHFPVCKSKTSSWPEAMPCTCGLEQTLEG